MRTAANFPQTRCRFRRSTQHLLAVYSPEFGSPRSFWDVDSSAGRLGRAALVTHRLPVRGIHLSGSLPILQSAQLAGSDKHFPCRLSEPNTGIFPVIRRCLRKFHNRVKPYLFVLEKSKLDLDILNPQCQLDVHAQTVAPFLFCAKRIIVCCTCLRIGCFEFNPNSGYGGCLQNPGLESNTSQCPICLCWNRISRRALAGSTGRCNTGLQFTRRRGRSGELRAGMPMNMVQWGLPRIPGNQCRALS